MTKDNIAEFLEVGRNFKNKTLLEAAVLKCSQEIRFMDVEMVAKIDPRLLNRILMISTSVPQNVDAPQFDSLKLSQMVANSISRSATQMTLTLDVFRSLTTKTVLPSMDPIAAIKLLAAENFLLNTSGKGRTSLVGDNDLQERCFSSIQKNWAMVHNRLSESTELSNVMRSLSSQVLFDLLMKARTLGQGTDDNIVL